MAKTPVLAASLDKPAAARFDLLAPRRKTHGKYKRHGCADSVFQGDHKGFDDNAR
jgi:hypothetical protein